MLANVMSQNPLYCKAALKRYTTSLKMKPFTPAKAKAKVAIIRQSTVWEQVVQHEPSKSNNSVLHLLKFAQVPFVMLRKVLDWNSCSHACDRMDADCSCRDDPAVWCKHVAPLCYVLVDACEIEPLVFLKGMGIELQALLDEDRAADRRTSPRGAGTKRQRHGWVFSPTSALAKRPHAPEAGSVEDPIIIIEPIILE